MEANRAAPVFAEGFIHVASTPEVLWDLMADLESWPHWNADVQSVVVNGPVAKGTTFRWKSGPIRIVSTLREVNRPTALGWTGRTMGIRAIHVWRFEPGQQGAVASMEESFEGGLTPLLRKKLQRQLDKSTEKGLVSLRTAAEQHAG